MIVLMSQNPISLAMTSTLGIEYTLDQRIFSKIGRSAFGTLSISIRFFAMSQYSGAVSIQYICDRDFCRNDCSTTSYKWIQG